jgi:hypothetical protein
MIFLVMRSSILIAPQKYVVGDLSTQPIKD